MKRTIFSVLLLAAACGGQDKVVRIAAGDSTALYAAVSNPAYADYTIELSAGTYALIGLLTLGPGQTLRGTNQYVDHDGDGIWDPTDQALDPAAPNARYVVAGTETILDGTAHTARHVVEVNAGNELHNLTVRAAGQAAEIAKAPADQGQTIAWTAAPRSTTPLVIEDVLVTEGSHGIFVGGERVSGTFRATIRRVVITSTTEGLNLGGADNAVIAVDLQTSRITGRLFDETSADGQFGVTAFGLSAKNLQIDFTSRDSIFDSHTGAGVFVIGGFAFSETDPRSENNRITWTSTRDHFTRNGHGMGALGGALLEGALDFADFAGGGSSQNQVTATLVDSVFASNLGGGGGPQDVAAVGGSYPLCGPPGSGNLVTLEIRAAMTNTTMQSVFLFDNNNAGAGDNHVVYHGEQSGLAAATVQTSIGPACGTM